MLGVALLAISDICVMIATTIVGLSSSAWLKNMCASGCNVLCFSNWSMMVHTWYHSCLGRKTVWFEFLLSVICALLGLAQEYHPLVLPVLLVPQGLVPVAYFGLLR